MLKTLFYRPAEYVLLEALDDSDPITLATTFETQRYVDALERRANDPDRVCELWVWRGASGQHAVERLDSRAMPDIQLGHAFTASLFEDELDFSPEQRSEIVDQFRQRSLNEGYQFGTVTAVGGTQLEFWWVESERTSPLPNILPPTPCINVTIDDHAEPVEGDAAQTAVLRVVHAQVADIIKKARERYPQFLQRRPASNFLELLDQIHRISDGAIVVIPDAHQFINFDPSSPHGANALTNIAALKDCYHRLRRRQSRTRLVLLCGELSLPRDLREEVQRIDLPLPMRPELYAAIRDALPGHLENEELLVALSEEAAGMTLAEVEAVIARARARSTADVEGTLRASLRNAKKRHISRSPALEFVETGGVPKLGGMERFGDWLDRRRKAFNEPERARTIGINRAPRGVLLLGIPGSGKSLAAKMIARSWFRGQDVQARNVDLGLPLLRLDMGAIQDKWVGSSEARAREALRVVEAMAPCVLWIDEIDKSISQESHTHSGEMNVRATLLTWMQECSHPVFVVATANRFAALPPELTRAGRFDARFFFGCPSAKGRREIIEIHLSQRGYDAAAFDLEALTAATHGFTGAEIEQVVLDALYEAFERDVSLSDEILTGRARETQPLIRSAGRSLEELWELVANGRVEMASEEMLTRAQVAKLIDPHLYRPIYCRLEQIEGFEKHASRATRLLMATPFGGPAAIVMDSGEHDWIYVQVNFRLDRDDAGHFKALDTLQTLEMNFLFDTLVSDHGLETIYFETAALRQRFEKSDMLSAYAEFFRGIDAEDK
ncbi:MAG: AAA family ATPase [Hyphomicrobiales bacterium]